MREAHLEYGVMEDLHKVLMLFSPSPVGMHLTSNCRQQVKTLSAASAANVDS